MRYFGLIVLLLNLMACNPIKQNEVHLNGDLKTIEGDSVVLYYGSQVDTLVVDGGQLEITLQLDNNEEAFLETKDLKVGLYLMPGYTLDFKLDADNSEEPIQFTKQNDCVLVNQYFIQKKKLEKEMAIDGRAYFSLEEEDFAAKTQEIFVQKKDLLNEFIAKFSNKALEVADKELTQLKYSKLCDLLGYEKYHRSFTYDPDFVVSAKFKALLSEEDLNLGYFLEVPSYFQYLKLRMAQKSHIFLDDHPNLRSQDNYYALAYFTIIEKQISDPKVRDFLSFFITRATISSGLNNTEKVLEKFNQFCSDPDYQKQINDDIAHWEKLNPGKMAPDFEGINMDGAKLSLSDLQGKYVYVDVWATWCGPCKREIPYLEKLEKEYHGRNITFLSVSVDDDIEKWKKMVTEKNMGGIQINAGYRTNINKDYKITGIPRFMLFDTEGKIITVNAPRPSGKIREILDGLKNL